MARKITPIPLTAEAFSPFGDVIEPGSASEARLINEGHTTRFHDLAGLDLTAAGGKPTINIFRSEPLPAPVTIKLMERHPKSSQAFYPLGSSPYLVVVAPPGDLDCDDINVFIATSDQGVNYHRGTWHHYSLALNETSDFLVVDRDGPDENCDEITLPESDWITIELTEQTQ